MPRQYCKHCVFRTVRKDSFYCVRHNKWIAGEDSKQFFQADNSLCDFQPKVSMENPVELEE